ncbi:MAG: DMT family transporter [Lachnospiraceae bacterium]|nr:DMT family transporter [Lachnospiraceae bacterium]
MKKTSLRNPLLLLLTATIWGVAFVAQSVGMDYVGPFTFSFTRCMIGGAVLIPCIALLDRLKARDGRDSAQELDDETNANTKARDGRDSGQVLDEADSTQISPSGASVQHMEERVGAEAERPAIVKRSRWFGNRTLLCGGICCGIALCVASNLQQIGIQYTSVGKAGFITAMYIILVPVFNCFRGQRAGAKIWVSVLLAVAGLYLLCITEGFSVGFGDLLVLLCAAVFAIHILVIDYFSPKVDGVRMSCIQFFVCGLLSGVGMLIFETPTIEAVAQDWLPIGYAGVLSCGVAYTLQIVGQKGMDPTVASLILSLESVVSVLSGWLILGQSLSGKELFGCVLMFLAIILAQLPDRVHGQVRK